MNEAQFVFSYTRRQVEYLLKNRETGPGKAEFARLRRGVGRFPGELPELWGIFLQELPEKVQGKGAEPSYGEWAVYIALTVFAMHQQGISEPMHREGISLGEAVRGLSGGDDSVDGQERILRRFRPIVTATDMVELSYHLRNMIQLLRQAGIPLDYGKLAEDLYYFQWQLSRRRVQLSWGRDFYKKKNEEERTKGQ